MPPIAPPSAALLPPAPDLRFRLAVALQEVDLLRRLLRVVAACPSPTSANVPPVTATEVARG